MSDEVGLSHLDKLQPFILISSVFLGIVLGTIFPGFAHYSDAILYVTIIVLVYSVMLGVPHQKIWKAYRNWRFFGIAWFVNFVIIPLMAWGLATFFLSNYPPIFVGFILYLVTPCTDWFLMFTLMAGGDVPLALALLPTNLILQVVLIPVYLILFAGEIVSFQFSALIETMLTFVLLPFICAGLTRLFLRNLKNAAWAKDFIEKILSPLQAATLTVVLLTMFAGQTFTILDNIGPLSIVFVPLVVFFSVSFVLSWLVSQCFHLAYKEYALLTCTAAARNSPLSLAIAFGLFPDQPLIQVAIIIGVLIELPILVLIVRLLRRLNAVEFPVCGSRCIKGDH